jgi:alanyl aminopeptidase
MRARMIHARTIAASAALLTAFACGGTSPSPVPTPPAGHAAASVPAAARLPEEPVPLGPLPRDARPTRERLALTLDPEATRFAGTASIDLTLDRPRDVLWLHGRGLTIRSCDVALPGGDHVAATWSDADPTGVARVSLARPIEGAATLTIAYDAAYDESLVGVYRAAADRAGARAVFSKFEAIYARRAFPCFDEPSFKVPFDVSLTVPHGSTALGNMPIASRTATAAGDVVTFASTPPLPTYLVAFAVGPFEARSTPLAPSAVRSRELPLAVAALRGKEGNTAFALAEAPALVAEEERYYGVAFPYPKLDLLAVPDFQSGAMENAGLITFRDSALLVDARTSTLAQRIGVRDTIAHELAHQWFGDLVTMRWWDDLWLNESFASFLATRTLRAVKPELEVELGQVKSTSDVLAADGLASTRRIRQPIASTDDITNAFDGITYAKGEAVLAMVERFVGEEAFRAGLHAYLEAHAGGNATTADLVSALSAGAHRDLSALFASFLDQPGAPLIVARTTCDHGKGAIAIEQSRWLPYGSKAAKDQIWTVPVCARAQVAGKVIDACTLLDARTGTIPLPGCADWAMTDADGRGYYRSTLDPVDLAHLRDRGMSHLTTAERVALAGDLDAAFRSASLSSVDALRAVEPLAKDAHGAVASTPLSLYRFVSEEALVETSRAKLGAYVRRLYAPAVRQLGWRAKAGESTWRALERTAVLTFLAKVVGDPAVIAEGARLGRAYLGLGEDGALHPDRVDPDLAALALACAVRQAAGDARVFDALRGAFERSNDAVQRKSFLVAMASTRDAGLAAHALDLALDPGLRKNERLVTIAALLSDAATRDLAWRWIVAHFDTLAPTLPDRYAGYVPRAVAFCDEARAREVEAFFGPRMPKYTGGTRNLAQAVEGIASCAKLVSAQRESAEAFVRKL